MTEPLTFVRYEMDEQTRDELQPPCEATESYWLHVDDPAPYRVDLCPQPAVLAIDAVCARCGGLDKILLCDPHGAQGLAGLGVHGVSNCDGYLTVVSVVRL